MTAQPLADPSLRAAVRAARLALGLWRYRIPGQQHPIAVTAESVDCDELSPFAVRDTIDHALAQLRADLADELIRLADAIAFPWREVAP